GPGSSSCARHGEPDTVDRVAPTPERALSPVSRGGVPDRPSTGVRRPPGPARLPLRPRPGSRRGGDRSAVAGPGGTDAPPLARARGERLLRALLLRLCHTVLPRAEPGRARRPSSDTRGR